MPPPRKSLEALRRDIDALDDRIHDALLRRAEISAAVRAVKGDDEPALRPGREAAILRRLVERHRGALPAAVIVRLWREILSASVRLQGPFAVAVDTGAAGRRGAELALEHFGALTPVHPQGSTALVLNALAEGRATVGLVPLPQDAPDEPWWRGFGIGPGADLRIVGRLPVAVAARGPAALLVARQAFDPSDDDRGYLVLDTGAELSHARIKSLLEASGLVPLGFPAAVDDRGAGSVQLVEIAAFVDAGDPRLEAAAKALGPGARVRSIGGYAAPLELSRS